MGFYDEKWGFENYVTVDVLVVVCDCGRALRTPVDAASLGRGELREVM